MIKVGYSPKWRYLRAMPLNSDPNRPPNKQKTFEPISNEHISLQLLEDVPISIYAIKPLTNPQPPYKDIPYASATWILVFDFNYLD